MNKSASEPLDSHPYKTNGLATVLTILLSRICSLDVDMNNANKGISLL